MKNLLMAAGIAMTGIVAVSVAAKADDAKAKFTQALNNTQHEITTCVAYFNIISHCATRSKMPELAESYKRFADKMTQFALVTGQKANLGEDAMVSRLDIEMKSMAKLLNGGCQNISSLMSRHLRRCEQVAKDPTEIIAECLAK
jgi:hypothetical protein